MAFRGNPWPPPLIVARSYFSSYEGHFFSFVPFLLRHVCIPPHFPTTGKRINRLSDRGIYDGLKRANKPPFPGKEPTSYWFGHNCRGKRKSGELRSLFSLVHAKIGKTVQETCRLSRSSSFSSSWHRQQSHHKPEESSSRGWSWLEKLPCFVRT